MGYTIDLSCSPALSVVFVDDAKMVMLENVVRKSTAREATEIDLPALFLSLAPAAATSADVAGARGCVRRTLKNVLRTALRYTLGWALHNVYGV